MRVGKLPLVFGGVAGVAGVLIPALASAQTVVDTYVNYTWRTISQTTCLARAVDAIDRVIDLFDLPNTTTREDEWYVLGDADDPNFWVFCIPDDDTDNLVGPNAKRVMVSISVSTTRGDELGEGIRDFLTECVAGACPEMEPPGLMNPIDWTTTAGEYRGMDGELIDFECPPLGTAVAGTIWGTTIYTDDSAICQAAAHMGVITQASGGIVTIEIMPGQSAYRANTRNGITSNQWSRFEGSFRVVIPAG